ncbi:MAG: divergent PAP2 family protein [Chloroflexi bacterium]|nr:MAG: divergent PAP2 family protein [Chloroflexota bacterium]
MTVRNIFDNQILAASFLAWLVAQMLKVVVDSIHSRRLDFSNWASAGGMPSSHSALVAALATAVGLRNGFASDLFAIALIFAVVVMYDAAGVRRAASAQARILNQMIDELFQGHPISEERLRELLGHTPIEVLAGAAIGVLFAWWIVR